MSDGNICMGCNRVFINKNKFFVHIESCRCLQLMLKLCEKQEEIDGLLEDVACLEIRIKNRDETLIKLYEQTVRDGKMLRELCYNFIDTNDTDAAL